MRNAIIKEKLEVYKENTKGTVQQKQLDYTIDNKRGTTVPHKKN